MLPFGVDGLQGPVQDQEALLLGHHIANRCLSNGAPLLLLDNPVQLSRCVVRVLLRLDQRVDGLAPGRRPVIKHPVWAHRKAYS